MKKLTLTCLLAAGVSTAVFGQSVFIDLTSNAGGPTATTGGLLYKVVGGNPVPLDSGTVNVTLLGGATSALGNTLASLSGANACFIVGPGQALDVSGNSYAIPGLGANAAGFFEAQWWTGNASSFANAGNTAQGGAATDIRGTSGAFSNPTGGPPSVPPGLTGMPSVTLLPVPEPSTMVLCGLGLASLLVFRRRN